MVSMSWCLVFFVVIDWGFRGLVGVPEGFASFADDSGEEFFAVWLGVDFGFARGFGF